MASRVFPCPMWDVRRGVYLHLHVCPVLTRVVWQVQAKLIARVAVAHKTGDHAALDELVKTDAWKTLVTVARDQASTKSGSSLWVSEDVADFAQALDQRYPTTGSRRFRRICWRRSTVSLDQERASVAKRGRRRPQAKRSARIARMLMQLGRRIVMFVGCR